MNNNDYLDGSFNTKYYINDILNDLNKIQDFLYDNGFISSYEYSHGFEYRFSNLDGKSYINNDKIYFSLNHNDYSIELNNDVFKIYDNDILFFERTNNQNNILDNRKIIVFLDDLEAIKTDLELENKNELEF